MTHHDAFHKFFHGQGLFSGLGVPALPDTYDWDIPLSSATFVNNVAGRNSYERNVALKHALNEHWQRNPDRRRELLEWIVKDWGGIRGNKPATLDGYLVRMSSSRPETPLQGIASFSKVLAIADPHSHAIYDARVAVSLNAIQLLSGVTGGLAFPYVPGRNKTTGDWSQSRKRGFSTRPEFAVKKLCSAPHTWRRIVRDKAYGDYLRLLGTYTSRDFRLYDLEMALFSQAEVLAKRAMT
ncbi:MAG: hypothetical protein RIE53_09740 [Rhodothermales bacterium]